MRIFVSERARARVQTHPVELVQREMRHKFGGMEYLALRNWYSDYVPPVLVRYVMTHAFESVRGLDKGGETD